MTDATGLDLGALREYALGEIPGLVFVTVSGAHLYGFPSPDSDVDLRGMFTAPLERVLALDPPQETHEAQGMVGGVEVEIVGHEIGKYLRLLVKPNGYVLEQILSPLTVVTCPAHEELQALARASFCRRLFYHYHGFAGSEWRQYRKSEAGRTVKRLLYIHRVLMTGITLLEEGVVECDIRRLAARFGMDLEPLIAQKTRELAAARGDGEADQQRIEALFARLEAARDRSPLPEEVPNRASFSDFLVRLRLGAIG